jgi:hypothetical protein
MMIVGDLYQPDLTILPIGDARRQALAADRPAVVAVMTGGEYRAPEPWGPR